MGRSEEVGKIRERSITRRGEAKVMGASLMAGECRVKEAIPCRTRIRRLLGRQFRIPLVVVVEPLQPGFVAHVADISVFGYGDDVAGAVEALKDGIENLCRRKGYLHRQAKTQRMLLLENLIAGEERE